MFQKVILNVIHSLNICNQEVMYYQWNNT